MTRFFQPFYKKKKSMNIVTYIQREKKIVSMEVSRHYVCLMIIEHVT